MTLVSRRTPSFHLLGGHFSKLLSSFFTGLVSFAGPASVTTINKELWPVSALDAML